jgi:purine-binding chemotaxis protein CheW
VILEVEQQEERHDIGVVVDTVSAVLEIADADIEPAPSFGAKLRTDFIKGMGKLGEKFVILLDIGKVLSVEELSLLAAAGEGPAAVSGIQSARLEGSSAQGARLAAPGTSGAVKP